MSEIAGLCAQKAAAISAVALSRYHLEVPIR
jgi:hypothetical protein